MTPEDASPTSSDTFASAAYGGEGWAQRSNSHDAEIGNLWAACGIDSEWRTLETVLLHRPGSELAASLDDPDSVQMLAPLDLARASDEHAGLAEAYRREGIAVHGVEPEGAPTPNQMFCADLFVMTPQGAILARPASDVRAGEERWVARRLADLGVPILRTLTGRATFEGADLMWLDEATAIIGCGLRTNQEAIEQITTTLEEIGCQAVAVDMPFGTMHLMGMLRIADRDLAIAWPRRTPHNAVMALRERGYQVAFLPDVAEAERNRALNFVTLGPRKILMVAGNPTTQAFYEGHGIECLTAETQELSKAAGNIGCLTGVIARAKG
jgi:N-dimethylarginine dimethylaminohydrolase